MNVLAISPYHAGSHSRWLNDLQGQFPDHNWTVVTLPPRAFSWRYAGNAFSIIERHGELLNKEFDVLLATSMTNLIALRGLLPRLSEIRTVLYFHENQFSYPVQHVEVERERFHFCMQSLYAAMAADTLVFNSEYNRKTFLQGVRSLLRKMPDHAPKSVVKRLELKSQVLPVPISDTWYQQPVSKSGPLQILWNHRWEYDKAPERFFQALSRLHGLGLQCKLHVVGQSFKNKPSCFNVAKQKLETWIATWGYLPDVETYKALLTGADLVVSTALHEFQGIAVLEAAASGCHVLAPDRLAYPEWFTGDSLYRSHPDDAHLEVQELCGQLEPLIRNPDLLRERKVANVRSLSWSSCRADYAKLIDGD